MTSTSPMHETGHPKQCSGTTQRDGVERNEGGGFRMGEGEHVFLWQNYVNVWHKPSQYYKEIILKLK